MKLNFLVNPATILSLLLLVTANASAEVYKYEDPAGNLYFTDRPLKTGKYRLVWRSRSDPLYASSARINFAATASNRARFRPLIKDVAKRTDLQHELLHAVIQAESAYDPKALSKTGAMGLMQLMPATAKRYGVSDSWNPEMNVDGGARYLQDLIKMFDNNLQLALAAYNAGENAVKKYGNKIPPYPETQGYVKKVLSIFEKNKRSAL